MFRSAAAVLIGYWNKVVNPAAWITVCMVVVIVINMLGAGMALWCLIGSSLGAHKTLIGAYGEAEFIFALVGIRFKTIPPAELIRTNNCIVSIVPSRS